VSFCQWPVSCTKRTVTSSWRGRSFSRQVVRNSSCASCYKYLADIYYDNGEYDLAVKFFNQSLSIGSYSEAASVGLGNALIMSGDFERAKMMYEKIFAGNTKGEETLYRLVSVYLRTGMLEKAKSLFAQYSAGRKSGWIQLALGEISEAQGSFSEALIAFTVAATLMPENPLAHSGAGRINLAKKEYDKAIEDFGRALGNAPHNVDFLIAWEKPMRPWANSAQHLTCTRKWRARRRVSRTCSGSWAMS